MLIVVIREIEYICNYGFYNIQQLGFQVNATVIIGHKITLIHHYQVYNNTKEKKNCGHHEYNNDGNSQTRSIQPLLKYMLL